MKISARARYRLRVAGFVCVILISNGANLLWTSHVVQQRGRDWCTALDILTSEPAPKPADPRHNLSRERTYEVYQSLAVLKHRRGC